MATVHAYFIHKLMRRIREEISSTKFKMSTLKNLNTLSFLKSV